MKRIFLTTTIIALGSFTAASAQISQAPSLTQAEFTQVSERIVTTTQASGLHNGDFQAVTRSANTQNLYRGDGSSLMTTTRSYRD